MACSSMRMLVYLSCLFTCQLRDLSRNFPRRTPPTDNCGFFRTVKKKIITAISENSSFLAKSLILAMQQLRATTKSLTFPPLSIARYSFKQLSQLGRQWRERKCPIFETVAKGDSNPGSLDCESGILALRYRAPLCDPKLPNLHTSF